MWIPKRPDLVQADGRADRPGAINIVFGGRVWTPLRGRCNIARPTGRFRDVNDLLTFMIRARSPGEPPG